MTKENSTMRRKIVVPTRFTNFDVVTSIYSPENRAFVIDEEGNVYHFKLIGMNMLGEHDDSGDN